MGLAVASCISCRHEPRVSLRRGDPNEPEKGRDLEVIKYRSPSDLPTARRIHRSYRTLKRRGSCEQDGGDTHAGGENLEA